MNNYFFIEEIGKGKYSVVYKGRKKQTIEYYAIKSVDKVHKEKVDNEVNILHILDHENVLKFWKWYETPNHLWLIVEYCSGGDLMNVLLQDTKLPECTVQLFAKDLLNGLLYMHSKGVIYCDLKPSNILFNGTGVLKFCDFGLSRRIADITDEQLPQTKRGTPCYMGPELFYDESATLHSFASDLYSLGCVLYELAAGKPPFVSNSFSELTKLILSEPFSPVVGVSPLLNDLLEKLLKKDPIERIGWSDLINHPYWNFKLTMLTLPAQPYYDSWIQRRINEKNKALSKSIEIENKDDIKLESISDTQEIKSSSLLGVSSPMKDISKNLASMSLNASRNIERERETSTYEVSKRIDSTNKNTDILLNNPDEELNFEDGSTSSSSNNNNNNNNNKRSEYRTVPNIDKAQQIQQQQQQQQLSQPSQQQTFEIEVAETSEEEVPAKKRVLVPVRPPKSPRLVDPKIEHKHLPSINDRNIDTPTSMIKSRRIQSAPQTAKIEPVKVAPSQIPRPRSGSSTLPKVMPKTAILTPRSQTPINSQSVQRWLVHASDKVVKPIIEPKTTDISLFTWPPKIFPVYPLTKVMNLSQSELESFLTQIYKAITGKYTVPQKLSFLDYFENLCVNSASANILVECSLVPLFVNVIRSSKFEAVKAKILHVIGVLIRHATVISTNLQEVNLLVVLTELMRDKEKTVKRSAAACLGELLFYIATQDIQPEKPWHIPTTTVMTIIKSIRPNEDESVLQCVLQTLENIATAQSDYARPFITSEVANNLFEVFISSASSPLPSSAPNTPAFGPSQPNFLQSSNQLSNATRVISASALSRICKVSPQLLFEIIEKHEPKAIMEYLSEGNSKIQQSFLNLLNIVLFEGNSKIQNRILEESTLISSLKKLLEHSQSQIRAKALLTVYSICQLSPAVFLACCEAKFLPVLERISKDKEAYVRHCIKAAIFGITNLVPTITNKITIEIRNILEKKKTTSFNATSATKSLKDKLYCFPIILHLMTSPILRYKIFTADLIADLSYYLTTVEDLSFLTYDDFKGTLLLVLEAISQNPALLAPQHEHVILHLLPSLISLLKSESGDTRFLSLKIFIDVLSEFMSQPSLYSTSVESITTRQINDIISRLLPSFKQILCDEDPIPPFGLKLLNIILERNGSFLTSVHKLNLLPMFLKFFQLDHPNNNIHNIKLIKRIVESIEVDKKQIYELGIVKKLCLVFEYAYNKSVETFLEPVLDIFYCLLTFGIKNNEYLTNNLPLLEFITPIIKLLNQSDTLVSEKAGKIIEIIPKLYILGPVNSLGQTAAEVFMLGNNIAQINITLEKGLAATAKHALLALKELLANHPKVVAPFLSKDQDMVRNLNNLVKGSKGAVLANVATEMLKGL